MTCINVFREVGIDKPDAAAHYWPHNGLELDGRYSSEDADKAEAWCRQYERAHAAPPSYIVTFWAGPTCLRRQHLLSDDETGTEQRMRALGMLYHSTLPEVRDEVMASISSIEVQRV